MSDCIQQKDRPFYKTIQKSDGDRLDTSYRSYISYDNCNFEILKLEYTIHFPLYLVVCKLMGWIFLVKYCIRHHNG